MTMKHRNSSASLAEFVGALLFSSAAIAILTVLVLVTAAWLGIERSATSTISISDCAVGNDGEQVLASCWMLPANRKGMRHVLASIDLRSAASQGTSVSMPYSPIKVIDTWSGDSIGTIGSAIYDKLPTLQGLVAVSRDEILVISEPYLRAVDLKTKRVRWRRDDLNPDCLAFTQHGNLICGLSAQGLIEVSPDSGEVLRTIRKCDEPILAVAVDPYDASVVYLTGSGRMEMCSLRHGRLLWSRAAYGSLPLPRALRPLMFSTVLCFSPDGRDLVSAAFEQGWNLAVWDARTGERLQTLRGHDAQINGVAYLPDGTLLSWSGDGTLRLWDVARGFARRVISLREVFAC